MIELSISMALFLYLAFTAILMLLVWSFIDLGTGLKTFSFEEKSVRHCEICSNTYINSNSSEITECPVCGTLNERVIVDGPIKRTGG